MIGHGKEALSCNDGVETGDREHRRLFEFIQSVEGGGDESLLKSGVRSEEIVNEAHDEFTFIERIHISVETIVCNQLQD